VRAILTVDRLAVGAAGSPGEFGCRSCEIALPSQSRRAVARRQFSPPRDERASPHRREVRKGSSGGEPSGVNLRLSSCEGASARACLEGKANLEEALAPTAGEERA